MKTKKGAGRTERGGERERGRKKEIIDLLNSNFSSFPLPLHQTVQQRGAAVIKARKLSSAMSAAKAICDHMTDWWFGTKEVGVARNHNFVITAS